MIGKSDQDLTKVIACLAEFGVEAGYLVPTPTGLKKSILDAHKNFRQFLESRGIHNFDLQKQGTENKVIYGAKFLISNSWKDVKISLYRPSTKHGDPRIWISGMQEVNPWNLLAFIVIRDCIWIVNCSAKKDFKQLILENSELKKLLGQSSISFSRVERELLEKLREIAARGFVPSTSNADNGVGDTLENLLQIERNSNKDPDYFGIEIKASRLNLKERVPNRSNLFSKSPNWEISSCKNGQDIVRKYGYTNQKTGRKALQVTLRHTPNPQGLFLNYNEIDEKIDVFCKRESMLEPVVTWNLSDLQSALSEKHQSTFWVRAETQRQNGLESFRYRKVLITQAPFLLNFPHLVDAGIIQLDFTFSEKSRFGGGSFIRDHGYLWKIHQKDLNMLFPPPREIQLI